MSSLTELIAWWLSRYTESDGRTPRLPPEERERLTSYLAGRLADLREAEVLALLAIHRDALRQDAIALQDSSTH